MALRAFTRRIPTSTTLVMRAFINLFVLLAVLGVAASAAPVAPPTPGSCSLFSMLGRSLTLSLIDEVNCAVGTDEMVVKRDDGGLSPFSICV